MTVVEIKKVFMDKKNAECPITERLIKAGYQQLGGGYIAKAKSLGLTVDYKQALPTQWWHLIESYCNAYEDDPNHKFTKQIQCGELLFWMAEVLECVDECALEGIVSEIIARAASQDNNSTNNRPKYNRRYWNKRIQALCFDKIVISVESQSK